MKHARAARIGGYLLALLLLAACSRAVPQAVALEPTDDTACALDGMLLKELPGSKAQIHYAEGKPDFLCDLKELFATVLMPEQKRRVTALFVQDMGKTDWDHPTGNWINAKSAYYVVGSKKLGPMGPSVGSFGSAQDAEDFVKKQGGKIVRFDQVTPDMVGQNGSAAHDTTMGH